MENAADALKMAAAVLIFVMAISLAVMTLSQARAASQAIIYTKDDTNYYSYVDSENKSINREVGLETVIPTLYRYYRDNIEIVFNLGSRDYLYETKTKPAAWTESYRQTYGTSTKIHSFDSSKEGARGEAWKGSIANTKANLDNFINGTGDYAGIFNGLSFKEYYKNAKFKEEIGEYAYKSGTGEKTETSIEIDGEVFEQVKQNKKRVITYTLIER